MLVVFRIGDQRCAVDVNHVRRAMRVGKITPLIDAPPAVLGVADIQGNPLLVISGRAKFGGNAVIASPEENAPILIIETNAGPVALLTDKIEGVMPPDPGPKQALPGVVRVQTQLVTYVEPDQLIEPAIKLLLSDKSLHQAAEANQL